jgi:hypothetical protein
MNEDEPGLPRLETRCNVKLAGFNIVIAELEVELDPPMPGHFAMREYADRARANLMSRKPGLVLHQGGRKLNFMALLPGTT